MIPIGEVMKFNPDIDEPEELTPSLHAAVMRSLGSKHPTRFGNARYVFENTCFTDPLKLFVKSVISGLSKPGTTPFPLIKGFGFGKTHSMIILWHIFSKGEIDGLPHELIPQQELIRQTITLACDVSDKEPPLKTFVELLKAYTKDVTFNKDPEITRTLINLFETYDEYKLSNNPSELLEFLVRFVEELKKYGKMPRILLLIDELGYGIIKRIDIAKDQKNDELIDDARKLISFLSSAAEELQRIGASLVIVYALAEQDLRSLDGKIKYYADDESFSKKIEGLKTLIEVDLRERLKRYTGGLETTPLQVSPRQNIEIAKFRVFKIIGDIEKAKNSAIGYIESILRQYQVFDDEAELQNYLSEIKQHYPISPDLLNLLRKVHDLSEFPRTEYVRTVISILKDAAKSALISEPEAPTIGVRFLSLNQASLHDTLDDAAQIEWFSILSDISKAIESSSNPRVVDHISKIILSKGTTSNILALIELGEKSKKYGTTVKDIQASIISTTKSDEVNDVLESYPNALTELKIRSARVVERTLNGDRYYFPSVIKHIFSIRESYIIEERKKVEEVGVPSYLRNSRLYGIFLKLRGNKSRIVTEDFESLVSGKFLQSLEFDKPNIILIPPWDLQLFNAIESRGYDSVLEEITKSMNELLNEVNRPPFLIVALPNTSKLKVVVDTLIDYTATARFLEYLKEEQEVIKKYSEEIRREIIRKREEIDEKNIMKQLSIAIQQQIRDARNSANQQQIRNGREIIASILSIYEKPIHYKVQEKCYASSDTFYKKKDEKIKQLVGGSAGKLEEYSNIVGKFLEEILGIVGFEDSTLALRDVIYKKIKEAVAENGREYISLEEVLENFIVGNYGVLPINVDVANEAINKLNNRIIDFPDKVVRIKIDRSDKKIKFEYKPKEPKMILRVSYFPYKLFYDPGEIIKLSVKIINEGATGDCIVRIKNAEDGSLIESYPAGKLETGESVELAFEVPLPKVEGEYRFVIESLHELTTPDDEHMLKFAVKEEKEEKDYAKKIIYQIVDEKCISDVLRFVQENEKFVEGGCIAMNFKDVNIDIKMGKIERDDLDVIMRFILTLAKRFKSTPELTLHLQSRSVEKQEIAQYLKSAKVE